MRKWAVGRPVVREIYRAFLVQNITGLDVVEVYPAESHIGSIRLILTGCPAGKSILGELPTRVPTVSESRLGCKVGQVGESSINPHKIERCDSGSDADVQGLFCPVLWNLDRDVRDIDYLVGDSVDFIADDQCEWKVFEGQGLDVDRCRRQLENSDREAE
jgi:hypothetical protein